VVSTLPLSGNVAVRHGAEIRRIAAAYPPEAKHTPRWEREKYMTELQQLAWLIRFDPDAVPGNG
jgi:hypothetical protein